MVCEPDSGFTTNSKPRRAVVFSRHQCCTRSRADRSRCIRVCESNPLACQLIQVRSFVERMAVTSQISPTQIVRQDEQNIRALLRKCRNGKQERKENRAIKIHLHEPTLLVQRINPVGSKWLFEVTGYVRRTYPVASCTRLCQTTAESSASLAEATLIPADSPLKQRACQYQPALLRIVCWRPDCLPAQ